MVRRCDEHILELVRKYIDGKCPQFFKELFFFNKDICPCSTARAFLHPPVVNTAVARRSFYYYYISKKISNGRKCPSLITESLEQANFKRACQVAYFCDAHTVVLH